MHCRQTFVTAILCELLLIGARFFFTGHLGPGTLSGAFFCEAGRAVGLRCRQQADPEERGQSGSVRLGERSLTMRKNELRKIIADGKTVLNAWLAIAAPTASFAR